MNAHGRGGVLFGQKVRQLRLEVVDDSCVHAGVRAARTQITHAVGWLLRLPCQSV